MAGLLAAQDTKPPQAHLEPVEGHFRGELWKPISRCGFPIKALRCSGPDNCVCMAKRSDPFAQWTPREHVAIAQAHSRIDTHQVDFAIDPMMLKPVVE